MESLAFTVIALLFFLVFLVIVLFVANWAITDARYRGKSPILVVCAVIFFFPWGWIAWLLFRPPPVSQEQFSSPGLNFRRENALERKRYRKFIRDCPEVEGLSSKERHEQFRAWMSGN